MWCAQEGFQADMGKLLLNMRKPVSAVYSMLTVAYLGAGAAYLALPSEALSLMFHMSPSTSPGSLAEGVPMALHGRRVTDPVHLDLFPEGMQPACAASCHVLILVVKGTVLILHFGREALDCAQDVGVHQLMEAAGGTIGMSVPSVCGMFYRT